MKKAKYSYRLSVNLCNFQGEYLESKVRDGTFASINHAIRVAVDRMAAGLPPKSFEAIERVEE